MSAASPARSLASSPGALPATRALSLVARGVFLETIRRKEFYVLLLLTALFALAVLVVGLVGIENAATATFLLNLGMTVACAAAHILVLLTAARQIPNELETRSLYPLLAKPLERSHFVLGKWLAATLTGIAGLAVLLALAWIPAPKAQTCSLPLLLQTVMLQAVSLAMMAALATTLSLVLPRGVNLALLGLLYAASDKLAGLIRTVAAGRSAQSAVDWVCYYIPDFNSLNLITRYTDGVGPLPPGEFLGLIVYGAVFAALSLWAAILIFNRRAL